MATIIGTVIAIPLGTVAALSRGTSIDTAVRIFAARRTRGSQLLAGHAYHHDITLYDRNVAADHIHLDPQRPLAKPVTTYLACTCGRLPLSAVTARPMVRSSMLESSTGEDYIRTHSRAKAGRDRSSSGDTRCAMRCSRRHRLSASNLRSCSATRWLSPSKCTQSQRTGRALRAKAFAARLHAHPGHGDAVSPPSTSR